MSGVDPHIHGNRQLLEEDVSPDPVKQFSIWFQEAKDAGLKQPEAMTLATCSQDGKPSARMVLLRGFDERGFVFFTNYNSRKSKELSDSSYASLVFYWESLDRQVRVEGRAHQTSSEESDVYFRSRPRGSCIGAWASSQSQVIENRQELEKKFAELSANFPEGTEIPRPPHWGGFRIVPEMIEFWQGQPNRLHDRIRYRREQDKWIIERLAP